MKDNQSGAPIMKLDLPASHRPPAVVESLARFDQTATRYAELLGELHCFPHVIEVGCMEAASHVGDIDVGHQSLVVAHLVEAIGLAHVAINHDHSPVSSQRLAFDPRGWPPAGATGTAGGALPVYFDTR